jgi:group I intron endonuclease
MVQIYGLIDPTTEQVRYVGKSQDAERRFYQHKYRSNNEKHFENTHLHRWLRKLSREGLTPGLVILEVVEDNYWVEREKHWIAHYGLENLCNMNAGGFEPPSPLGREKSEETRQKLSKAKRGVSIWSEERPHPATGKPSPCRGMKRSRDFKEKARIAKLGSNNPRYNKPQSPQNAVALLAETRKPVALIDENGKTLQTYVSQTEAAKALGVSSAAVSRVCSGEYKQTHGYRFRCV